MRRNNIVLVFLLLFSGVGISLLAKEASLGDPMAYPNPFDNKIENVTIEQAGKLPFSGSVEMIVYDYNLREVYRAVKSGSLKWSGYDSSGRRLRSGLYYIKLIQSDTDSTTASGFLKVLIK